MRTCQASTTTNVSLFSRLYSKPPNFLNRLSNLQFASSQNPFSIRAKGSSASSQKPDRTPQERGSILSEDELKQRLTPEQLYVTRQKGTERPFTGEYWNTKTKGTYHCICCDTPLFDGTGWPSYYEPIGSNVKTKLDLSVIFMPGQEVVCAACSAHLGHVFDHGPPPAGNRYCINSVSLNLKPN